MAKTPEVAKKKLVEKLRRAAETGAYEKGVSEFIGAPVSPNIVSKWKEGISDPNLGDRWFENYKAVMSRR